MKNADNTAVGHTNLIASAALPNHHTTPAFAKTCCEIIRKIFDGEKHCFIIE